MSEDRSYHTVHDGDLGVYLTPIPGKKADSRVYGDYRAQEAKKKKKSLGLNLSGDEYLTPIVHPADTKSHDEESQDSRKCALSLPLKILCVFTILVLGSVIIFLIYLAAHPTFLASLSQKNEDPNLGKFKSQPVDGNWGNWTEWSICSQSCGGGMHHRVRHCDNPPRRYNGKDCEGEDRQDRPCNPHPCPVHGVESEWSEWSGSCSSRCARDQTETRERNCTQPQHGGLPCLHLTEVRNCTIEEEHCPVDGGWGEWTAWPSCTSVIAYCSPDKVPVKRKRLCDNPTPRNGGNNCTGDAEESKMCELDLSKCSKASGSGSGIDDDAEV